MSKIETRRILFGLLGLSIVCATIIAASSSDESISFPVMFLILCLIGALVGKLGRND